MSAQELETLWAQVLPVPAPPQQQFQLWLRLHSPRIVRAALLETSKKTLTAPGDWDQNRAIRFASAVMNSREGKNN